ncbi:SIR2 family protein [Devosia sp.]|uniref:SIR2 family protein n=1 Tax=Devosia sp. TaxID=1871048 RepID=UPI003A8EFD1E
MSLLTGAGVTIDAGAPLWAGLVTDLAGKVPGFSDTFNRHRSAGIADTTVTSFIHSRFVDDYVRARNDVPERYVRLTAEVAWFQAIRDTIYANIPEEVAEVRKKHPYIETLARFCLRCESTITFNFDDILDQVATDVTAQYGQPPKTMWSLPAIEKVNFPYIYHINGLLPQNKNKKASEKLIFTEDSFLQVLYGGGTINRTVLHNFTNNTFLLTGVSLTDHSLKSILATNATQSPGSIHYIIHWIQTEDSLTEMQMHDISHANFELFNLVTIFLTSEQIKEFLDLVQTGVQEDGNQDLLDENFKSEIRRHAGPAAVLSYKYYIAGPVASGKSTLLENLRCFETLEEWPERTPAELYMDHKRLEPEQRLDVDRWVYRQLKVKNKHFVRGDPGIHVMDRAPLDLFAFSIDEKENRKKAGEIKEQVENDEKLSDGAVMLVVASPDELVERQLRRGRLPTSKGGVSYDGESLKIQTEQLKKTYPDAIVYNTDSCDSGILAKRALYEILYSEYAPLRISELNDARHKRPLEAADDSATT